MKKVTNNIFKFIYKFLLIFTIIIFSIALFGGIFFYENRSFDRFNPIPIVIGIIIYIFLIFKIIKFISKLNEKQKKYITIGLIVVHFLLLLISAFLISSIPQVDLIHILKGINSLNSTNTLFNSEYFSVYPNNQFLLLMLYNLQKLSPANGEVIFKIFSSLCITIAAIFTYKSIKKVFDQDKALTSLIIWVTSPIFYLYVSYYYTDILMLPFASILFYLIILLKDETSQKKSLIYSLLVGIIAIIGYKIRAVSIFLLIAYFVYLVLTKNFKNIIKQFIPIILTAGLTIISISIWDNQVFNNNIDKDKEFPLTHWIMMGLNPENDGYYNQDDYDLSFRAQNKEERTKLNIEVIKSRLSSTTPLQMLKLFNTKINTIWAKGDYSYQKYLALVDNYNYSYHYLLEDKNIILNYALQIIKLSILVLSIFALIALYKTKKISIIAIALFGASLFYLIWEVCPRYGLSFLPWLIILINYSFSSLEERVENINTKKVFKYGIFICSIIVLFFGFYKYTKKTYKDTVVATSHSKKVEYFNLDKETDLKQSVNLYKSFNEIDLKFRFDESDELTDSYTLELLDNDELVLYKKEFKKQELNNDKYTIFPLDKDYEKGNYYIKLSTNSSSNLQVYLAKEDNFDLYKEGALYINDEVTKKDLMFDVVDSSYRGTYNTINYSIFMITTLFIEYVILFKKEKEVNEKK